MVRIKVVCSEEESCSVMRINGGMGRKNVAESKVCVESGGT